MTMNLFRATQQMRSDSASQRYLLRKRAYLGSVIVVIFASTFALYPIVVTYLGDSFAKIIVALAAVSGFALSSLRARTLVVVTTAFVNSYLGNLLQVQALVLLFCLIMLARKTDTWQTPSMIRSFLALLLLLNMTLMLFAGGATRDWLQNVLFPCLGFLIAAGVELHSSDRIQLVRGIAIGASVYAVTYLGSALGFWTMPGEYRREIASLFGVTVYRIWAPGGPLLIVGLLLSVVAVKQKWFSSALGRIILTANSLAVLATLSRSILTAVLAGSLLGLVYGSRGVGNQFRAVSGVLITTFAAVQIVPRTFSISSLFSDRNALVRVTNWQSLQIPDLLSALIGTPRAPGLAFWDAGHIQWIYGLGLVPLSAIYIAPLWLARRNRVATARGYDQTMLALCLVGCLVVAGFATDLPFSLFFWVVLGLIVGPCSERWSVQSLISTKANQSVSFHVPPMR